MDQPAELTRRHALAGVGAVALSLPVLAGCGDGDSRATRQQSEIPEVPPRSATTPPPAAGAGDLVAASDVPVGGGVILSGPQLVVTQPTAGAFKAFSSICTHNGCPVTRVDSEIHCPCHNSSFSITDGSVLGGPAPAPLPETPVSVSGNQVTAS